ncbi:pyridoxamine 5'-phosphate oxidase family protein [Kitasatospora sp. NPDC006697]|uniref:pyridoxamine 5'-phosphate oxidase family protein n=1 Tax=Kitasatospora sp. NPDC006697 TaxID=3364020 RepID=UPI003691E291
MTEHLLDPAGLGFGSSGEHELQRQMGTSDRAADFYRRQVRPCLTQQMREFVARQTMVFIATADGHGACDASFRAGPPGFVQVLDDHTLAYPEYRGNGVMASAGNISENPHLGLLFVDFTGDRIGLHINGTAQLRPDTAMRTAYPELPEETAPGRRAELWVRLSVDEAYIHCSKHIPHLQPVPAGTRLSRERPRDPDYFTGTGTPPPHGAEPAPEEAAPIAPPVSPPVAPPSWARPPAAAAAAAARRSWRLVRRREA